MTWWRAHTQQGVSYTIDHLHPMSFNYSAPENPHGQKLDYNIRATFSHHCFTRTPGQNEVIQPDGWYRYQQDLRAFCNDRYSASLGLPAIIGAIHTKRIFHSGQGNFAIVDTADAPFASYAVYFYLNLDRSGNHDLHLRIQSAYPRNDSPSRRLRKIRFQVLANNTYYGIPIRQPP